MLTVEPCKDLTHTWPRASNQKSPPQSFYNFLNSREDTSDPFSMEGNINSLPVGKITVVAKEILAHLSSVSRMI